MLARSSCFRPCCCRCTVSACFCSSCSACGSLSRPLPCAAMPLANWYHRTDLRQKALGRNLVQSVDDAVLCLVRAIASSSIISECSLSRSTMERQTFALTSVASNRGVLYQRECLIALLTTVVTGGSTTAEMNACGVVLQSSSEE